MNQASTMGSKSKNNEGKVTLSRDKLKELNKYFICPICGKTMKNVVSIVDCTHSFCKKCISDKLEGEDLRKCPVCSYEIGANLDNYLREDYRWRDVIGTIQAEVNKVKEPRTPDQSRLGETSSQANSAIDRSTRGGRTLRPRKR